MLRRTVLAGAVLLLLATAPVTAAKKIVPVTPCMVIFDPVFDAAVSVAGQTRPYNDAHVDLVMVEVASYPSVLAVDFYLAELNPARRGSWEVTFRAGKTALFVRAGYGAWTSTASDAATMVYRAGVVGTSGRVVKGHVDVEEGWIRVELPYSALGKTVKRGTLLSSFAARTEEVLAATTTPAPSVVARFHDEGRSRDTYRIGEQCHTTTPVPGMPPPPDRK